MSQVIIDLVYNAAILIALTVIYDSLPLRRYKQPQKLWFQVVTGLLISLIAIAVLSRPWQIIPGLRIDARSVLLSISGLFFGLIPTLFVTITALIYRVWLGGIGMPAGLGLIVTTAAIGLVWRYARKRYLTSFKWWELYVFGVIVHIIMLFWMYLLPEPHNIETLEQSAAPIMLLYPVITVFLGFQLAHQTTQHEDRESLQLNEAHYRRIVETASEGIWAINARGITTFINPRLTEITGYSEDEMVGKPMSNFVHDIISPTGNTHTRMPGEFRPQSVESTYRRKDGKIVWMRVSVTPLFDDNGNMDGGLAMVTDITAQKQAEQELRVSEQLFRSLFEQSSAGVVQVDPTGNFLQVNNHFCDMLGYSREELLSISFHDITYPPDAHVDQEASQQLRTGLTSTFVLEKRCIHKQGHLLWVRIHSNSIRDSEGKVIYTVANIVDITDSRRAEEERQQQQELLQSVVDNIPVMIAMHDQNGKYILSNHAFTETMGWDMGKYQNSNELMQKIYPDPAERQRVLDDIQKGDLVWRNYESWNSAGETRQTSWANAILSNGNSISFGMDVTERHEMESALRDSEQLFKSIFDQSAVSIALLDASGRISQVNARLAELTGYTHDELVDMTYFDLSHPEEYEETLAQITHINKTKAVHFVFETRCLHQTGRPIWVEIHGNVVRDSEGNQLYSVIMLVDITERRLAEQERRKQQELLQSIVDNIPVMITMVDAEGHFTFTNRMYKETLGWDADNYEYEADLLTRIYPDSDYRNKVQEEINSGDRIWRENLSIAKDGRTINTSWANATFSDGSHISFGVDITERHQMESDLRASEQLFKSVFEQSATGVAQVNAAGDFLLVNARMCEIVGYSSDELLTMKFRDITHPEDHQLDGPALEMLASGHNTTYQTEKRYIHKSGHIVWVRIHGNVITAQDGQNYALAVIVDITKERLAEQERRRQQELLQTIVDNIPVMIAMGDEDGNFLMVNRAYEEILGWDISSHQNTAEMLAQAYPDEMHRKIVTDAITEGKPTWRDFETQTGHGHSIYSSWANVSLSDGSHIGFGMDVTERHEMESALRNSEQLFKSIFEQSAAGVAQVGPNGEFLQVNTRLSEILGYSREELLTMGYQDITHPEDHYIDQEALSAVTDGADDTFVIEKRYIHKRGHIIWVRLHGNIVFDEHRKQLYAVVVIVDITEERLAEIERRRQQELLQTIVDNIPVMIAMADKEGHFLMLNRAYEEIMGWDMQSHTNSADMLAEAYADEAQQQAVADAITQGKPIWRDYRTQTGHGHSIYSSWANVTLSDGRRIGFGMDISARKRAEIELQAQKELLQTIMDNLPVCVNLSDPAGNFAFLNRNYKEILGWTIEETPTIDTMLENANPDLDKREAARNRITESDGVWHDSFSRTRDGREIPMSWIDIRLPDGSHLGIGQDITERKRAEMELQEQKELLQTIVDYIPVVLNMTSPDGHYIFANRAYRNILGWDIKETPTINHMLNIAYTDPADREFVLRTIEQCEGVWRDYDSVARDGQKIPMSWIDVGLPNGNHLGIGQDITERKQAELIEKEHKELLQTIVDHVPVLLNITDPDGIYVYANRTHTEVLGWTQEELVSVAHMLDLVYPDPKLHQHVQQSINSTEEKWQDFVAHTRDGRDIPMSWIDVRLPDGNHLGIGQDITERLEAQKAIQQQKELLQTIVDHLPVVVNLTDADGNHIFLNRAYHELLGWSIEETPSLEAMQEIAYPDPKERKLYEGSLNKQEGVWQDYPSRTRDGHEIPMSWINVRLPNGNYLGIGQDITERKMVEQKMRQMNAELERRVTERTAELESRNRELQTFTYSVSHDLKAPLRGIDGYSRLLEMQYKDKLDTEGQHFISRIRHATDLMGRLIEDLLSYSRLEQQPMLIQEIRLRSWMKLVLDELAPQIELTGVDIVVDVPDISINADPEGLSVAMRNLIDNALKFSASVSQPRIEIGAESCETCHRLWVKDNGIGFDMQFHDRIFGIFQRLHHAEDYPGTGVGLAIVQRAMQRMNGRTWAESEMGEGAIFYLEIPVKEHDNSN